MQIQDVIQHIEALCPLPYAEDFDNVGLLVGQKNTPLTGVLVTLDTLENVVEEAIAKKCNLIVSFHPIIFSGLKKLNGSSYVERVVIQAIANNIAIYAMHTALDNCITGVHAKIAEVLGLKNQKILIPKKQTIKKLEAYIPTPYADKVKQSLFKAGAGDLGLYKESSFSVDGQSSFTPKKTSTPNTGEIEKPSIVADTKIEVLLERHTESAVLKALHAHDFYQEIAYSIHTVENKNQNIGIGMVGELTSATDATVFLKQVKQKMQTPCIRHSQILDKKIQKVAVLGGSGAFAIGSAIAAGADILITSDLKYHDFFKAESKIILADIGHYESEQFTKQLLVSYLTKKFRNFAIVLSDSKTNPIKYL